MSLLIKRVILFVLLLILSVHLKAQAYRCDTLEFGVSFPQDKSDIDLSFNDNGKRLREVQAELNRLTADSATFIRYFSIYTSAFPEGTVAHNRVLSEARSKSIRKYLTEDMGIDARLIQFKSIGEDWGRLRRLLETMDSPPHWVPQALEIIDEYSCQQTDAIEVPLKRLDGGRAWAYMNEHLFPILRSADCSVSCVIQRPVKEIISHTDTVYISSRDTVYIREQVLQVQNDTVFVGSESAPRRNMPDYSGRKFLFAARTNVLAVPLANVGILVPVGKHWSIGADYYYPWIWRDEVHEDCYELLALDLELRYWFNNRKAPENSRLLGHSIGIYGATGYYDYQWDWSGHQGYFMNAGIDYLYSCPIAKGRMHLEFELGFGYIYSRAQPYDCFKAGEKCYRRTGVKKYIHWVGPTRAQVSLVVPIYGRKKEVRNEGN